jgi:hypothetical protein
VTECRVGDVGGACYLVDWLHTCLWHRNRCVTLSACAGVTSAMLQWWWANVEGDAQYAGDGRVWSKYLQW